MDWFHLCATCLLPISRGREGGVVVASGNPENPVTVYVHDNPECRRNARPYPRNLDEIKAKFDKDGQRLR